MYMFWKFSRTHLRIPSDWYDTGLLLNQLSISLCLYHDHSANAMAPPEIKQPPSSTVTNLVSAVNLTCMAEGHPAPTYEWYKDGILIPGEQLPFLYIPEVSPADRGNYSCKAINNNGRVVSELAHLEIPGIQVQPIETRYQL